MIKATKLKKLRDSKHYNQFREDLNRRIGDKKKAISVQSGDNENNSTPENSIKVTNGESSINDIPYKLSNSITRSGSLIRSIRSPRNAILGPSNSRIDTILGPLKSRIEVDAILAAISSSNYRPSVIAYGNIKKTITKPINNKLYRRRRTRAILVIKGIAELLATIASYLKYLIK